MLLPSTSRYRYYVAVEKGIVKPGEICTFCGVHNNKKIKGSMIEHHEDYDKPLETITLCASCHSKLHISRAKNRNYKKFKIREKRKRNRRLVEFAEKHPDYTQQAIGAIFRLDRSRVSRILKKMKAEKSNG